MDTKIYIYDGTVNDYVELEGFLSRIDEKRTKQLRRLAGFLLQDGKLEGPNIDYQGDQIWKVSVVNEQNYFELHLLRRGEEVLKPIFDFRNSYRGLESMAQLNLVVVEKLHPDYHGWNPREQESYNTEVRYTLNEYFEVHNFRPQEKQETIELINQVLQRKKERGVHELSSISYHIERMLRSKRYLCIDLRIV